MAGISRARKVTALTDAILHLSVSLNVGELYYMASTGKEFPKYQSLASSRVQDPKCQELCDWDSVWRDDLVQWVKSGVDRGLVETKFSSPCAIC